MKKSYLTYTASIEALTGLGLLLVPSRIASILFGVEITEPVGTVFALLSGAAISSIALLSWLSRNPAVSPVALPVLLFYNIVVSCVLLYAALGLGFNRPAVWAVVVFHLYQTVMAIVLQMKLKSS